MKRTRNSLYAEALRAFSRTQEVRRQDMDYIEGASKASAKVFPKEDYFA